MLSFKDIFDMLKDHEMLAIFILLALSVSMYFFVVLVKDLYYRAKTYIQEWREDIRIIRASFQNPDGSQMSHAQCSQKAISVLHEVQEVVDRFDKAFMDLVHSTALAASKEHWHTCPIDKCPYLAPLGRRQETIIEMVKSYRDEFMQTQEQNRRELQLVHRRFDEITCEELALLRQLIKERRG